MDWFISSMNKREETFTDERYVSPGTGESAFWESSVNFPGVEMGAVCLEVY